jgi:energy-coupling factor transport system ATP-binding protein
VKLAEVERLRYTYPAAERPALEGLDLELGGGELVLLAGPSGCGKSTLLRALNGLVPHFHGGRFGGRVSIAGLDTRRASPLQLAGLAGLVFQEPEGRFLTGSVADEIAFALEVAGLPGAQIRSRVEQVIERLGLGGLRERPLDRLSGGEQQRVAVAAALAREPALLLLDEPTSQLDAEGAAAVLEWLVELRAGLGLTALVAEHRLERLTARADRTIALGESPEGRAAPADLAPLEWPCAPPAGNGARLRAQGLRFAYNGRPALEGVGLELRPGEVLAVVGRNGSGKSTLLRCLIGLLRPESGAIWLEGERVEGRPAGERARRMAYVPQWPSALLFAESVREELAVTLRNHGLLDRPPVRPETLLEALGLAGLADRYPRDLSAGERQRAAIAAVTVTAPGVVLLDEPTLGIDPAAQRQIGRLLEAWRRAGVSVLLATHDHRFAAAHADRALRLEAGRVAASGPAAAVLAAAGGD